MAGISKLKLVYAHTVMKSVAEFEAAYGPVADIASCPQATPDDDLDTLVGLAVDTTNPVAIMSDGQAVGMVSKDMLLKAIQGEA